MANDHRKLLTLERYLLGELPAAEIAAVENALAGDDKLVARLELLKQSNREILQRYPSDRMGRAIELRLKAAESLQAGRRRPLVRIILPLLAAACLVVVFLLPDRYLQDPPPDPDSGQSDKTIVKGPVPDSLPPGLYLYRRVSAQQIETVSSGSALRSGDLLQIAYKPGKARFGTIFSIDARGTVTLHYPEDENGSNALTPSQKPLLLPNAYELDDAPDFERFFFVTSDRPFRTRAILVKANNFAAGADKRLGRLTLDEGFDQITFTVEKKP